MRVDAGKFKKIFKAMKNICLIIPSLQAGGMERVMSELAWYFSDRNDIELHLILYGINRDIFYPIPETTSFHKPTFEFDNSRRFRSTLRTLKFLRKTIKSLKPDTILSFGEYWNSFVLLALLGLPYPVFVSDRCQPDKPMGKLHTKLRRCLYPRAKGIIAQTKRAKEIYATQFFHENVMVIGNPVRHIKNNGQKITKDNIILSVGRLIHSKHYDQLIKMFININQQGWKLVIVGDDALKQQNMIRLKKLVKHHNAADRIILAGRQSNVECFYLKSKVFAFTSSSEGFPNVIGEAMSAGIPVISFDCVAGPSDMISNGKNGFLIPLFDYKAFESKLEMLMQDEELRARLGASARVSIQQFAVASVGEKFYQFITAVD